MRFTSPPPPPLTRQVVVDDSEVTSKGRLGPGQSMTIDLATGEFRQNLEVKTALAALAPCVVHH